MGEGIGLGPLVDVRQLQTLAARLVLDLVVVSVVIHGVYVRLYGRGEIVFTCYVFNIVTLCLCVLLRKGPADLGVALTLFGVFGILRYRTEQIRGRDLTYLFAVLGLALINGISGPGVSMAELLLINGIIAVATVWLEVGPHRPAETVTPMLYDRLDLLQPGRQVHLIEDIAARTGVPALRVRTERIDLLRDSADITVYSPRHRCGASAIGSAARRPPS